jgi:hypothetical protein
MLAGVVVLQLRKLRLAGAGFPLRVFIVVKRIFFLGFKSIIFRFILLLFWILLNSR